LLLALCLCTGESRHSVSSDDWQSVISMNQETLSSIGIGSNNAEVLNCGVEGLLVRSRDQSPLRIVKRNLIPFSRVRLSIVVAFLDLWNGESIWITLNNQEIWTQKSSWRIHGSPTCLSPYSDLFVTVSKEVPVRSGTTSLDLIVAADLQTAITVGSFGFSNLTVEILPADNVTFTDVCEYTVEATFWFEIASPDWSPNQAATLECANGNTIPCGSWFNRYACQSPDGICPSPRRLFINSDTLTLPESTPQNSSDQPLTRCCSLGRSCTDPVNASDSQVSFVPTSVTCEYIFNSLEDTSFLELSISDMTKNVKIECGNGNKFICSASQWGKYTCSFKDKFQNNLNVGNSLCPEPRNAIINGQCCNLGKGCSGTEFSNAILADFLNVVNRTTAPATSTPVVGLLTLASVCGVIAVAAVVVAVVVLYKRVKAASVTPYSRLP